jgi:8-oxo-dGTP pyrophosphatase MutT (NUDIX family)
MTVPGALAFAANLDTGQRRVLADAAAMALTTPPAGMVVLWLVDGGASVPQRLGLVHPDRATLLTTLLPDCQFESQGETPGLHWRALQWSSAERSRLLQETLLQCHARGLVHGWRNEAFAFWSHDCITPPRDEREPLLAVERAGFRFLGIRSHAVHINGFTPDGQLWCGRRAFTKATDPGLLDNVTAGGLPAGETPETCAVRELFEEAGASLEGKFPLHARGTIRTARLDAGGWHDETLMVYNWTCPEDWQPHNQDGEVAEFMCLSAAQTMERILAGAFTCDAVASLAQGLALAGNT